jgi:kynurenine formamidase
MQKVDGAMMQQYSAELKNWNKWGPDDELGTLNYVRPEHIVEAARLIRKGKVFSMAIDFAATGPQTGKDGRINPAHAMLATGTDAVLGKQDARGCPYADDMVTMPLQAATHWDALGHIFHAFDDKQGQREVLMWNGYPASYVGSRGLEKCGIQNTRAKMVGRGVLLDVARYKGMDPLPDGFGITVDDLEGCANRSNLEVRRGDFVLVRTGQVGKCVREGKWGDFAGGDAPGLEFETLKWLHDVEVAGLASDTWGVEVRPNRSDEYHQPWHQVCIPILGLTHGEIFYLDDLAADCAEDGRYEFFFVAPTIPFVGATASPINPLAIK